MIEKRKEIVIFSRKRMKNDYAVKFIKKEKDVAKKYKD